MNKNLLGSLGNFFLIGFLVLTLTGCKIGRQAPVVDYGKYRANIFFEFNKSEIISESSSNLDVILATMKQFLSASRRGKPRKILIEIRGDASEEKSQKGRIANERIKKERAEKVASELAKMIEKMELKTELKNIEIMVLDDKTPREECTPEEAEKGYKRAIVDITFIENKIRGIRKSQIIEDPKDIGPKDLSHKTHEAPKVAKTKQTSKSRRASRRARSNTNLAAQVQHHNVDNNIASVDNTAENLA